MPHPHAGPHAYGVLVDASGEEQLAGGNASGAVVRVRDTVRKPWLATTEHVAAYLQALRATTRFIELHRERWELACAASCR